MCYKERTTQPGRTRKFVIIINSKELVSRDVLYVYSREGSSVVSFGVFVLYFYSTNSLLLVYFLILRVTLKGKKQTKSKFGYYVLYEENPHILFWHQQFYFGDRILSFIGSLVTFFCRMESLEKWKTICI